MEQTPTLATVTETLEEIKDALAEMNKYRFVDHFLDTDELCHFFKISSKTAKQWRDSGKLNYAEFGKKIYYQYSDIETMFKKEFERPKPIKTSPKRKNFSKHSSFTFTV